MRPRYNRPRTWYSLVLCFAAFATRADGGPVGIGDLLVVRVGDGSTALSAAAFQVSLVEYTRAGAFVQSIALPFSTTANNTGGLTLSGNVATEGGLNSSTDGRYVTLIGYDAKQGTATVAGTTSAAANRTIARVDLATGSVDTSTRLNDAFSGGSPTSAITKDGTQFWAAGAGSKNGVLLANLGATTTTQISLGTSAVGQLGAFKNNLLGVDTTKVSALGNFPTVPTSLLTLVTDAKTTPGAFVALNRSGGAGDPNAGGADTIYLADGTTRNSALQKFEWNGTKWVTRGTSNAPTTGLFGLTGTVSGGTVTLFATQLTASNNALYSFTDTAAFGKNISGAFTTLASAGANFSFQGVAIAQVPEPGSLTLAVALAFGLGTVAWRRRRQVKV